MTTLQIQRQQALFTQAYMDYEKLLTARASFKVRNRDVGKDLVQATFMKAWNYIMHGGEVAKMKSFLYYILNNLIIDEYRKHKTVSLDVLMETGSEPSEDVSERLCDIYDGQKIIAMMDELPDKYKELVRM